MRGPVPLYYHVSGQATNLLSAFILCFYSCISFFLFLFLQRRGVNIVSVFFLVVCYEYEAVVEFGARSHRQASRQAGRQAGG